MSENLQTNSTKVAVSVDQTAAKSLRFGILTFFPTDPRFSELDCIKCILFGKSECPEVPCTAEERDDKLNGYWSKRIDRLNENQKQTTKNLHNENN